MYVNNILLAHTYLQEYKRVRYRDSAVCIVRVIQFTESTRLAGEREREEKGAREKKRVRASSESQL